MTPVIWVDPDSPTTRGDTPPKSVYPTVERSVVIGVRHVGVKPLRNFPSEPGIPVGIGIGGRKPAQPVVGGSSASLADFDVRRGFRMTSRATDRSRRASIGSRGHATHIAVQQHGPQLIRRWWVIARRAAATASPAPGVTWHLDWFRRKVVAAVEQLISDHDGWLPSWLPLTYNWFCGTCRILVVEHSVLESGDLK